MAIDDLRAFRDVIARMVFSFNGEMDSPKRKSYARMLDPIPVDVIESALDRLINENAAGRKFFPMPTPADLKAACAKVVAERRKAAAALHLESCDHSSHWIEIDGRLRRCPCWTRAQAAMAAIGQAIALPPMSREDQMEIGL